jgi:RND family efflux transporter MFP subunit
MSNKKSIIIILSLVIGAAAITLLVFSTQPEAEMETATKKTAMLVDVTTVKKGSYRPSVKATGNVQPAKDVNLSPRVGGEVVDISEKFVPGSYVKKGEILLRIDPADYRNALQLRQSDLQLAQADLKVEMGRQDVAKKDYELIGAELSDQNKDLVLRKPQLEQAKANVRAAEAAVNQARLALERTIIRAPFDAHIISRNTNVGSQVSPGDNLGRIVGMDEYWVVANVPINKINWLSFSEDEDKGGSDVKIMNSSAWSTSQFREGQLFRMIGALDNQTRLARVIVRVEDPLLRMQSESTSPPLMIGTFVETEMEARTLDDVVKLNRDYLRKDNNVWVMKNGRLNIREVDILFEDSRFAYISAGLADEDSIVTTNLATVVEGSPLRLEQGENQMSAKNANE